MIATFKKSSQKVREIITLYNNINKEELKSSLYLLIYILSLALLIKLFILPY